MSRHTLVAGLLLGFAATLLPQAAPAAPAALRTANATAVSGPVAGETIAISGSFGRRDAKRAVALQVYRATGWTRLTTGRTSSTGGYALALKVPAYASMYRVVAPRTTKLPERVSATRIVQPVAQAVKVSSTAPKSGTFTATATATPARTGRSMSLQVLKGSTWTTLKKAKQSSRGVARFSATAPRGTTLVRVVASSHRGAPAVSSTYDVIGSGAATLRYRVVAIGSKTVEKGVETGGDRCAELSSTRTRSSTADQPTGDSPATWTEDAPQNGRRSVNIYPDYSSTYVDELAGCRTAPGGGTTPCARTIDWTAQFPTDRMTVEVRIAKGATTGEVVFFPPDASSLGYHDGWDDVCRVGLMSDPVGSIPLAERTVRLPLTTLLGSQAFRVATEGIFRDTADSGSKRTSLSSSWQQSITLQRVR